MNIIGLLSWYDEPAKWLTRCLTSLAHIPVDRLVALDGAYALYPDAKPKSSAEQHQAIRDACATAGIPGHIHIPDVPYKGNEVEKRNDLFQLAEQHAQPNDWYMVIDADEFVTAAPPDVHHQLEHTMFDVAAVTLNEPGHPLGTIQYATFPMFFRAVPGLRCADAHYRYRTPDGRLLWGDAKRDRLEARHDLTAVVVEHHNQLRHPDRRERAKTYYRDRDTAGIENLPAHRSLIAQAA